MSRLEENRIWADNIIKAVSPGFRPRWEIWDERLSTYQADRSDWLEIGPEVRSDVEHLGHGNGTMVLLDIEKHMDTRLPFVLGSAECLPFPDNSFDLVSLRFVVEHIAEIDSVIAEITRVLRPGGRLAVLTSNSLNPLNAASRIIPFGIRAVLISYLFRVPKEERHKVYGRLNTPGAFKKKREGLCPPEIVYISDLNFARKPIFLVMMLLHLVLPRCLRANILAVWQKPQV